MAKLYLIRHGITDISSKEPEHYPLSDIGQQQAEELAKKEFWKDIKVVASSSYRRCIETIEPAVSRYHIPLEISRGLDDLKRYWIDDIDSAVKQVFEYPEKSFDLKWETAHNAQKRIVSAIKSFVRKHKEGDLAICSSGIILSLYRSYILNQDRAEWSDWKKMGFTAVAIFDMTTQRLLKDF